MEKQVSPISFDEPKTTLRNQLLDLTLGHFCTPEKKRTTWADRPSARQREQIATKPGRALMGRAHRHRMRQDRKNDVKPSRPALCLYSPRSLVAGAVYTFTW